MFNNIPKEIIWLSMFPVVLILLIDLISLLIMRKKDKNFKFNYLIKISLLIANAFVLPLIGGYTIWIILKFINDGTLANNILYTALLIFLWIILLVLFIWVYMKARRELNEDEQEKEYVNDSENNESE